MHCKRKPRFDPSSPVLRTVFAAVALGATLATAGFIDALAQGHGTSAPLVMHPAPVVVAHR